MASSVDICNQALAHLGYDKGIVSLSDETKKEARMCNLVYSQARNALLREYPWAFATQNKSLTLLEDTHTKYSYAYQYPSGCLKVQAVVTTEDEPAVFEVQLSNDGKSRAIYCDVETAEAYYTVEITDVNLFDSLFSDALSFVLAARLAMPLKGQSNLVQYFEEKAMRSAGKARMSDASEMYTQLLKPSPILDSRG